MLRCMPKSIIETISAHSSWTYGGKKIFTGGQDAKGETNTVSHECCTLAPRGSLSLSLSLSLLMCDKTCRFFVLQRSRACFFFISSSPCQKKGELIEGSPRKRQDDVRGLMLLLRMQMKQRTPTGVTVGTEVDRQPETVTNCLGFRV